jgi:hypothetical protein
VRTLAARAADYESGSLRDLNTADALGWGRFTPLPWRQAGGVFAMMKLPGHWQAAAGPPLAVTGTAPITGVPDHSRFRIQLLAAARDARIAVPEWQLILA